MAHAFNASTQEEEAGGFLSSRTTQRNPVSKKKKKKKKASKQASTQKIELPTQETPDRILINSLNLHSIIPSAVMLALIFSPSYTPCPMHSVLLGLKTFHPGELGKDRRLFPQIWAYSSCSHWADVYPDTLLHTPLLVPFHLIEWAWLTKNYNPCLLELTSP